MTRTWLSGGHTVLSRRMTPNDLRPPLDPSDVGVSAITRVVVVGAGTMGEGISLALLNAGLEVALSDLAPDMAQRAQARIAKLIARDVEKGRIDAAEGAARYNRLQVSVGFDAVAGADLVIEAIYENLTAKREVFAALDAKASPQGHPRQQYLDP